MATEKENKEYEAAMSKIAELEDKLETANTPSQEDALLKRIEALEAKAKPREAKDEEDEDENDQCPVCGRVLTSFGDGTYHCPGCGEYFEEEE